MLGQSHLQLHEVLPTLRDEVEIGGRESMLIPTPQYFDCLTRCGKGIYWVWHSSTLCYVLKCVQERACYTISNIPQGFLFSLIKMVDGYMDWYPMYLVCLYIYIYRCVHVFVPYGVRWILSNRSWEKITAACFMRFFLLQYECYVYTIDLILWSFLMQIDGWVSSAAIHDTPPRHRQ